MKNKNTKFISYKKVLIFGAKSSGKTILKNLIEEYPNIKIKQPLSDEEKDNEDEKEKENHSNIFNIIILIYIFL